MKIFGLRLGVLVTISAVLFAIPSSLAQPPRVFSQTGINIVPQPYSSIEAVNISNIQREGYLSTMPLRDIGVFEFSNCKRARFMRKDITTAGLIQVGNVWPCTGSDPAELSSNNHLYRALIVGFSRYYPHDQATLQGFLQNIQYILRHHSPMSLNYLYGFPVWIVGQPIYVYTH